MKRSLISSFTHFNKFTRRCPHGGCFTKSLKKAPLKSLLSNDDTKRGLKTKKQSTVAARRETPRWFLSRVTEMTQKETADPIFTRISRLEEKDSADCAQTIG